MEEPLDPLMIGKNIIAYRRISNITASQLAEKAGISRTTLWQAERGIRIRRSSLNKIAKAFTIQLDQLLIDLPHMRAAPHPYKVHQPEQATWFIFPESDSRKSVPPDNLEQIQDPWERARLGRTGLVSVFVSALSFVMPAGPGSAYIEVHGPHPVTFNEHIYKDAVLHCLRGELRVGIAGDTVLLTPGSALGFSTELETFFEPVHKLGPNDLPPLLLWVGANRVGEVIEAGSEAKTNRSRKSKVESRMGRGL